MPDEAIVGGLLRIICSIVAEVFGFFLEYVVVRIGRIVICVMTFGRVDTDYSAQAGVNCLTATIGFLVIVGLCWGGWWILF